jgi:hypothetical protein
LLTADDTLALSAAGRARPGIVVVHANFRLFRVYSGNDPWPDEFVLSLGMVES